MADDDRNKLLHILMRTCIVIVVIAFVGAVLHYLYTHHISQDHR